jgi:uncharacterized protein (TIGR03083 family)
MIRDERAAFAQALTTLPDDAWDKPSLCPGWSIRQMVGHMIATTMMTPPKFFGTLIASGFRFDRLTANGIKAATEGLSNGQVAERYASRVDTRTVPPGPTVSWLGETIVHGEDVFRALGSYLKHPVEHVLTAADFYKGSNLLIGAKRRIEGVTLRATDADWQHGSGPEVSGPAIALVMAMTGRKAALDDLTGDGVAVLRGRD